MLALISLITLNFISVYINTYFNVYFHPIA